MASLSKCEIYWWWLYFYSILAKCKPYFEMPPLLPTKLFVDSVEFTRNKINPLPFFLYALDLKWWKLLYLFFPDVAGQFTAAPPTCPGDTFTFRCTVTGDMSGRTIWKVGNECTLAHTSTSSSSPCGPNSALTARPGTGFGTNGPSYSSTLSGIATPALSGTLVECFGQANNVDPDNRVGNSTIQILGV